MALNTFKRNHLMPLHFEGLMYSVAYYTYTITYSMLRLTMASSPMPLPMFSSSGMTLNLPAVPVTLMIKRIPNAFTRSLYSLPSRSYVEAYLV